MKDKDKITLTFGQLKKLVKESANPPVPTKADYKAGYRYISDIVYEYCDKNFPNEFGTIEFAETGVSEHEKEIKDYVLNVVSDIVDDVLYELEADA